MSEPAKIVDQILKRAAAFRTRHLSDPGVGTTYGYFTHHPVAPLNRKRLELILDAIQAHSRELNRPLRVLDIACGGGVITSTIAALGHKALGIDLSSDEIRLAELFSKEESLEGLYRQIDVSDPNWERTVESALEGKPDAVVLAYALHHLPEVEPFVARLSRWLPQGATLIVNEENPSAPLFRLKHIVRTWIQKDTEVEAHRSFSGWKALLEKHGFRVAPAIGTDLMPGLGRILPQQCWSLVFAATRG